MEKTEKIVNQEVNEVFAPLWVDRARYYILMGGRGAGRSTAGSQFVLSQLIGEDFFRCAIMRAVHADIRHSVWRELTDRVDEQGIEEALHITENDMGMDYGQNSVHAHGFKQSSGSNSAKLKSLANYNTVVIEEAEEIGEAEFMKLDDTLRTIKGNIKIVLLLNPPPKTHWIIQRWFDLENSAIPGFFLPKLKKTATNTVFIHSTFEDNLQNLDDGTIERYNAYEQLKPAYFYQMIKGLVPETVRGKIYNGWEKIDDVPDDARLVRCGEDFGWFPDPACAVAIYYWNGGYVVDQLAYGIELTNEYLAGKIKDVPGADDVLTIADSAEPKSIAEQKTLGLKVEGSAKGADSVDFGIKVVAQKKIWVTKRSTDVWQSYENYAWAEDKDGNPTGVPKHEFSHAMDAIRYPLVSLGGKGKGVSIYRPSQPTVLNALRNLQPKTGSGVRISRPTSSGWSHKRQ